MEKGQNWPWQSGNNYACGGQRHSHLYSLGGICEEVGEWVLRSEKYLEHLSFLVVAEPLVLDAYNHLVLEKAAIFLGE